MGTTVHPDAERLAAYDAQVRRMVADPDMRGDVLAVGLALAWIYRENGPGAVTMRQLAEAAKLDGFGYQGPAVITAGRDVYLLKQAFAADAPRYEMEIPRAARCEAPMIRKRGLCGKDSRSLSFSSTNWEDGTRTRHWFCRRHRELGMQLSRELAERDLRLRAERGDPPRPVANTGGMMARHFPGVDWDHVYSWARTGWKPPEQVPASYSTPVPGLQLIDGAETPEQVVGEPPALTVLHGMPDKLAGRRPPRRPRPGGSAS